MDLMNHGVLLASLGLTLLVPALLTLSAVLPLGSDHGTGAALVRRFGLGQEAAADLRSILPSRAQVSGSTTVLGALGTLFWALAWPAELGRGYLAIWSLPERGLRDMWRSAVWLASFLTIAAAAFASSDVTSGTLAPVVGGAIMLPVVFGWTWWSQHLLLAGRVRWRVLLPGAIVTTIALFGFSATMRLYVPNAIRSSFNQYGPLGIIFVLLTWLVGFAVVMLGGPLVGHVVVVRRYPDRLVDGNDAGTTGARRDASAR
jgi:membrane protein